MNTTDIPLLEEPEGSWHISWVAYSSLRHEVDALRHEVDALRHEVDALRAELAQAREEAAQHKHEADRLWLLAHHEPSERRDYLLDRLDQAATLAARADVDDVLEETWRTWCASLTTIREPLTLHPKTPTTTEYSQAA